MQNDRRNTDHNAVRVSLIAGNRKGSVTYTTPYDRMNENRPPEPKLQRAAIVGYACSSFFFGSVQTIRPLTLIPS